MYAKKIQQTILIRNLLAGSKGCPEKDRIDIECLVKWKIKTLLKGFKKQL